jgi:hypothetical protein
MVFVEGPSLELIPEIYVKFRSSYNFQFTSYGMKYGIKSQ